MKTIFHLILLYVKNFFSFILKKSPQWVDVKGYENIYQISEYGEIFNIQEMKKVSTFLKKDGYECVALTNSNGKTKQHRVHRLVALAFIENNENKTIVRHVDGNKKNNNVDNLKWV